MDSSLVWNDTPIHKRANGWINATEMCKANGKLWYAFFRSDRCQSYVKALAQLRKIYAVTFWSFKSKRPMLSSFPSSQLRYR